jgi:hypothetical protein
MGLIFALPQREWRVSFFVFTHMSKSFVFSSESVGEGHPDKVADLISDSVLDACLAQDRTSRVACETMVKSNMVILSRGDHDERQAQLRGNRPGRDP